MSLTAAAAISGGLGLLQTGLGIGKAGKAAKMRKEAESFFEKNKYAIPESAKAALGVAQRQASGVSLPAEDLTRARMGETTARGIQAARTAAASSSDLLASIAGLYANQQRNEQGLGIQAASRYDQNQRYLGQALNTMAGYETKKWEYNVLNKYQQQMGAAGQLASAGNQMISSGVGQIGSAASSYMSSLDLDKKLEAYKEGIIR